MLPQAMKSGFYDGAWEQWNDMIRVSPAPRIRREKVLARLRRLDPASLLDVGCGNGAFLAEARKTLGPGVALSGADISPGVIDANRARLPGADFHVLDLDEATLDRRWDAVVAMEVLEHCADFDAALARLAAMADKWLVVTVPCGPLFPIDRMVGHIRHFQPADIHKALAGTGFEAIEVIRWGFPFFNLYKHAINLSPERMAESFMSEKPYSGSQKLVAKLAYWAFRLSLPVWGYQLIAVLRRR